VHNVDVAVLRDGEVIAALGDHELRSRAATSTRSSGGDRS